MPPNDTFNSSFESQQRLARERAPGPNAPPRIDKYEIVAELGRGAFGRVYKGQDRELDRFVAIKVPLADDVPPELRELFLREARAAAKVKHPFVCEIYEVGQDGNRPFIVMPYLLGGTLAQRMAREPLPPTPEVLGLVRDLALALDAAHRKGVVHRDVKPANVLFDEDAARVFVTDFGLARLTDATASIAVKGTPLYMSPEQWRPNGPHKVGPPADVYSLGVILFQLLTGAFPFGVPEGDPLGYGITVCTEAPRKPSAVRPGLDPDLDALCLKALEKSPADRYASAKAFADEIENFRRLTERVAERRARAEAEKLFDEARERRRQAEADYEQGLCFQNGWGCPRDFAKARACYEKAAALGHAAAQFNLGILCAHGRGGTQDYARASELYGLAAAQGHADAQHNLGFVYEHGYGVPQDHAKAREWYEKAAAQGYAHSQHALGTVYENALGVPKDHIKAREWYERAAAQGLAEAKKALRRIKNNT